MKHKKKTHFSRIPMTMFLLMGTALSGCHTLFPNKGDSGVSSQTLLKMAEASFVQGDFSNSARLMKEAIHTNSEDPDLYFKLAQVYKGEQDWPEAQKALEKAWSLAPDNLKIQWELGKVHLSQEHPEEALAFVNAVLEKAPQEVQALSAKGICLDMLGRHAQAQQIYQIGLKVIPGHKELRNNLGLSYIFQGDLEKAIEFFDRLVAEDPSPRHRQNLAIAYGLRGDLNKAYGLVASDMSPIALDNNLDYFRQLKAKYNQRWTGLKRTLTSLPAEGARESLEEKGFKLLPAHPLPSKPEKGEDEGPVDAMGNHQEEEPIGHAHEDTEGHFENPMMGGGAAPSVPERPQSDFSQGCEVLYGGEESSSASTPPTSLPGVPQPVVQQTLIPTMPQSSPSLSPLPPAQFFQVHPSFEAYQASQGVSQGGQGLVVAPGGTSERVLQPPVIALS